MRSDGGNGLRWTVGEALKQVARTLPGRSNELNREIGIAVGVGSDGRDRASRLRRTEAGADRLLLIPQGRRTSLHVRQAAVNATQVGARSVDAKVEICERRRGARDLHGRRTWDGWFAFGRGNARAQHND